MDNSKPKITHPPLSGTYTKNLKVLLVEDSLTNIVIAKGILEKNGYQVDVAHNGLEAIDLIQHSEKQKTPFDIILMDLIMPEMDGIEATQRIRKFPGKCSKIPIIAMTGNASVQDIKKYLEVGMNAYISKPFDTEKLLRLLLEVTLKTNSAHVHLPSIKLAQSESKESDITGNRPLLENKILQKLALDTSTELVPEMVNIFIQELSDCYTKLQDALQKQNMELISTEAHTLKSTSGTYGALRLQATALSIDSYANANDISQVLNLTPRLLQLIEETIRVYKKHYS